MRKDKYILKFFYGCLMLTVLLLCGCAGKSDLVIETSKAESENLPMAEEPVVDTGTEPEADDSSAVIYVQVSGAVRAPGVYELPTGARVFEAVQKAGGMTDEAAPESLNQASELTDGQMIVICTVQEWEKMQGGGVVAGGKTPESTADDGRVNINTAGIEELCTISGIGQSRAQSIVTYREQNGVFGSIEDIMKVSGIKEGLFQKIKDKIKV